MAKNAWGRGHALCGGLIRIQQKPSQFLDLNHLESEVSIFCSNGSSYLAADRKQGRVTGGEELLRICCASLAGTTKRLRKCQSDVERSVR